MPAISDGQYLSAKRSHAMDEYHASWLLRKHVGELMELNDALVARIDQLKEYIKRAGLMVPEPAAEPSFRADQSHGRDTSVYKLPNSKKNHDLNGDTASLEPPEPQQIAARSPVKSTPQKRAPGVFEPSKAVKTPEKSTSFPHSGLPAFLSRLTSNDDDDDELDAEGGAQRDNEAVLDDDILRTPRLGRKNGSAPQHRQQDLEPPRQRRRLLSRAAVADLTDSSEVDPQGVKEPRRVNPEDISVRKNNQAQFHI